MSEWVETHGRTPLTGDAPLLLKYRCGFIGAQPYTVAQIKRWWHDGSDWDVVAVRRAQK